MMQKYSIFIGIDLSKRWFDVALYFKGQPGKMPHQRFIQSKEGYASFINWIKTALVQANVEGQWLCCMEHTGVYSLSLCHYLDQQAIAYVLENALRIKRSSGLRRGKSDKTDAMAIAEYAYRYQAQLSQVRPLPKEGLLKLQALLSLRSRLIKYRKGLAVASQELNGFIQIHISLSIAGYTQQVLQTIDATTKEVMNQIRQLIKQDSDLETKYQLLLSIIGIGPVIAAHLLVYTNGFTAFDKGRAFACYIGVAPFKQQSGTSLQGPDRISQIANHQLKALLSNAAMVAVRYDPQLKAFFHRQKQNGKEPGWIYNAIKNKIVHRVFAVIRRQTPYVKLDF